jgi:hypothetical protein
MPFSSIVRSCFDARPERARNSFFKHLVANQGVGNAKAVSVLASQTISSRWVGDADSQANNKDVFFLPEDLGSRA